MQELHKYRRINESLSLIGRRQTGGVRIWEKEEKEEEQEVKRDEDEEWKGKRKSKRRSKRMNGKRKKRECQTRI